MILIADSGSTKCSWIECSLKGDIINVHNTIGFNPKYTTSESLLSELRNSTLLSIKENFFAWDDNEKTRQNIASIYKDINFKSPSELDFSKIKEAFITPGISFNNKKLLKLRNNNTIFYRDLELYSRLISNQNTIVGGFFLFISLMYYSLVIRWNKRYIALN